MDLLARIKQFFRRSKFYRCSNCGYLLPKEEAVVSGWNSQQSLRHIHCPKCGKKITHA
ncbi:MAG: endonuclease Q family protein [Candidatus Bathyarchaeota archaeon]|nr:endonuclease Q family protein [Candidatus Bathyarchaeum sp.]